MKETLYRIKEKDMYVKSFTIKAVESQKAPGIHRMHSEVIWTNRKEDAMVTDKKIGHMIMDLFSNVVLEAITGEDVTVTETNGFSHSDWVCKASPTGCCIYDDFTDPVHDCCIHCGLPEERK